MTNNMPEDPFQGEDWENFAEHAIDGLLPMMKSSAAIISMVPKGPTDVKFAVELGFSIMLDKPIVAMIQPGSQVSEKLARVVDAIVEWDPDGSREELYARLKPILESFTKDDKEGQT